MTNKPKSNVIIQHNRIISRYLGLKPYKDQWPKPAWFESWHEEFMDPMPYATPMSMRYHESWDWLMPVIKQLFSDKRDYRIRLMCMANAYDALLHHMQHGDIEKAVKRCLRIINKINKLKLYQNRG